MEANNLYFFLYCNEVQIPDFVLQYTQCVLKNIIKTVQQGKRWNKNSHSSVNIH